MSFQFKKLYLKNWLVYRGPLEIEFSDFEHGRNLVTIHGKNGYGKTSLLRALEFLFHNPLGREEYFEHWHNKASNDDQGTMEVALEFTYRGHLFKLHRQVEFKPFGSTTAAPSSVKLINAQTGEEENQVQEKIDLMIPKKVRQFVFFDGAEIQRYAQKQHQEGVREAIERVLGIPAVRNLNYDVSGLIEDLEDEQAEIGILETESQELVQEIENLRNERERYREQKEDKADKVDSIEESAKTLEREMAELETIRSEREKLDEKKRRLADYQERRQELTKQIDEFLSEAPMYMLKEHLAQIVQEGQAKLGNGEPSRHSSYREQRRFLESLLDDGECVCERPMTNEVRDTIQEEIDRLSELTERTKDSSDSMFTLQEISQLAGKLESLRSREVDPQELMDRRAVVDEDIEEVKTDIRKLERKLEDHPDVSVREQMRQQKELAQQSADLRSDIKNLTENIDRVSKKIDEKQRRLDELTANTAKGKRVTRTLQQGRKVKAAVDEFVDRLVAEKRETIEDNTSEIFTRITNKPREYAGVRVNDDYTLEVYRNDGTSVDNDDLSSGEKEVLAYSFITALNLSSTDPAPFVMDTPFGHLDTTHRDRLLQSLPELETQVILLATDRDLPDEEQERIQEFVADEFVIRRNQEEAYSTIEER
jgi:DNA sulfur modification protein DndD